MIFQTVVADSF